MTIIPEAIPTSLVQIRETPVAAPGKCILCGATRRDDRAYVDFGQSIERYGAVYFCTFCFAEAAIACGFIQNEKYLALLTENEGLKKSLELANVRIEALNATLRQCFDSSDGPDTIRDLSDSVEVSPSVERSNPHTDKSNADPDEHSSVEGSTGIRSDAESDIDGIIADASRKLSF